MYSLITENSTRICERRKGEKIVEKRRRWKIIEKTIIIKNTISTAYFEIIFIHYKLSEQEIENIDDLLKGSDSDALDLEKKKNRKFKI